MRLCSDGHDEVAYDDATRACPACRLLEEIESLKDEIKELMDSQGEEK
jgi:hypothetical protein